MITRIDNSEYCKLNELQDNIADYDSVVLYLQCYKNINNSKDIYEFRTDKSKIYVASKTVVKLVIHDVKSMNVIELIENTINELNTRLKFIHTLALLKRVWHLSLALFYDFLLSIYLHLAKELT